MGLTISEQTEARLTEEARRLGISVEALLERLINERPSGIRERKIGASQLPVWPVGVIGPPHRRDIYSDVP